MWLTRKINGVYAGVSKDLYFSWVKAAKWMTDKAGLVGTADTENWQSCEEPGSILAPFAEKEGNNICSGPQDTTTGSMFQRPRLAKVAEYCASRYDGDIIEIGAFKGETSAFLAEVAMKYNRKLIVVDPWETGTQNCEGEEFSAFQENIAPFRDSVEIFRESSLTKSARAKIKSQRLCFSYVDGLHTYWGCLTDIYSVSHTEGIIAVDDFSWNKHVRSAFCRAIYSTGRKGIAPPCFRESYLLESR